MIFFTANTNTWTPTLAIIKVFLFIRKCPGKGNEPICSRLNFDGIQNDKNRLEVPFEYWVTYPILTIISKTKIRF